MVSSFDLRKKRTLETDELWTQEQDIFLIENNHLSIEELVEKLPFNEHQILLRKKRLGLLRRDRQLKRG